MSEDWTLRCVRCEAGYPALELRYTCVCGGTLDVEHRATDLTLATLDARLGSKDPLDRSGVWRFRELILPLAREHIVTMPEGNTNLYDVPGVAEWVGIDRLQLKHEGENPTGSFKDRGMTTGTSVAKRLGMTEVACASTGNTSASMAAYAARAGLRPYVFIPEGKIAYGKLSQALAYGARTVQIAGDFDAAMALVQDVCRREGIYLLNSVNPFRIEGQKAIGFEILQDLDWRVPDWIVLPGGNLGNNSALSKGLMELLALGLIDRLPRIAVIQADGANPLYTAWTQGGDVVPVRGAKTRATAIQIGDPISWRKSLRGLHASRGTVEQVSDAEILNAKALLDRSGVGAEPASCATVAGLKKLVAGGVVAPHEHVVGILTGHLLKDPDIVVGYHNDTVDGIDAAYPNRPVSSECELEAVLKAMRG